MAQTSDQIFNKAIEEHQNNNLIEAKKLYLEVLTLQPNNYAAHLNLGVILQMSGELNNAKISFQESIKCNPKIVEAYINLGGINYKLNELDEAEENYNKAIDLEPDYFKTYFNLGVVLAASEKFDQAMFNYNKAIKLKPDFAESYNNLAIIFQKLKQPSEAIKNFKKAIEIKSDYTEVYFNLGNLYSDLEKTNEAQTCYEQVIRLNQNFPEAYFKLGILFNNINKLDEALQSYKKAIELNPNFYQAYNNYGIVLEKVGKLHLAEENYIKTIELNPIFIEAYFNLSKLKSFKEDDPKFIQLQKLYFDKNLDNNQQVYLNFALGKFYENLKNFKKSYKHFLDGNSICKKNIDYNINEDINIFNQIKETYPSIKLNYSKFSNTQNEITPIFIVGMPRSGTSLIEQIISSHSNVFGAGELNFVNEYGDNLARGVSEIDYDLLLDFKNKYISKLRKFSSTCSFIVDKMPLNFKYIGLLKTVFPDAKIIHTIRNPAATCWGNYQQLFTNKNVIRFCYDLDDIVVFYDLYKDLMLFWNNEFSDKIYNLDYEKLTLNQEEETKNLISYLGLKWENKCLTPEENKRSVSTASNNQVRQKVYKGSSQKWKNYELLLNNKFSSIL